MSEAAPLLSAESGNYQPGLIEELPLGTGGESIGIILDIVYDSDKDWQAEGACRKPGVDADLFFPEKGYSSDPAKAICLGKCAVLNECRKYALKRDEKGVWGGMSERERRRFKRMAKAS